MRPTRDRDQVQRSARKRFPRRTAPRRSATRSRLAQRILPKTGSSRRRAHYRRREQRRRDPMQAAQSPWRRAHPALYRRHRNEQRRADPGHTGRSGHRRRSAARVCAATGGAYSRATTRCSCARRSQALGTTHVPDAYATSTSRSPRHSRRGAHGDNVSGRDGRRAISVTDDERVDLRTCAPDYQRAELHEDPMYARSYRAVARLARRTHVRADVPEPNAMCLCNWYRRDSQRARMVLLRGLDARGLMFYTSYFSRKGREIAAKCRMPPRCFTGRSSNVKSRIEGRVERIAGGRIRRVFCKPSARTSTRRVGFGAERTGRKPRVARPAHARL